MSLRGGGARGRRAAAGAVITVAALAFAPAAGPAQEPDSPFGVKLLTKSQRSMLKAKKVRLRIRADEPVTLRVSALLRRTGTRPRTARASFSRMVELDQAGRKKVSLRLRPRGRRELRRCRGHRLTVRARLVGTDMRARDSDIVRVDRKKCDPARGGDVIGGSGDGPGGGGGGNDDGDGGGGGGGTGRGTIDVTNADRCDFTDPAVCLFPWPSNHFTVHDEATGSNRRLNLQRDSMPKNRAGVPIEPADYNRNDGFSPGQMIVTKVPGLESQEAFERTGAVPITDLGDYARRAQPVVVINARTGERHPIWSEIDSNPEDPADVTLIIRPAVNFDEGTRYIVALRRLRDGGGSFIEAHRGFQVYRDRISTSEPKIEGRRNHFESLFDTLGDSQIRRDNLYLAWDFTVASEQNLSERVLSIRDDAFRALGETDETLANLQPEGTAPQFIVRGMQEDYSDRIARRIDGSFFVPCYLNAPGCPPGSRFNLPNQAHDLRPQRLPGNMMEARFRCHIPRSAVGGPPARVSLYGHGLLGSRDELGQGQLQDFGNEHNIVFCATDWVGMACPDLPGGVSVEAIARGQFAAPNNCDIPTVLTILQDLSNFPALADRVQQGLVNFLYLGRLLVHPNGFAQHPAFNVTPGGAVNYNRDRLFYDGNSQGGIIGGALAAVALDHERAVLGVPGMNYSTLLRRSVDFDTYAEGNFEGVETDLGMYDNYPNELERPLMLSMIQILWDRAEANGYAHHMTDDPYPNTPPHQVMLHVGLGDHQVAQVAAEVEARTIGARAREPYTDPGRDSDTPPIWGVPPIPSYPWPGSAIVMWDTGPLRGGPCDGDEDAISGTPVPPTGNVPPRCGEDPHEFPRRVPAGRLQKSEFLRLGGGVIDVCGPRPCYADGWTGP